MSRTTSTFSKITLAVLAILMVPLAPVASTEVVPADKNLSFLEGLTLVTLDTSDIPSLHRARALIQENGGRVAIMSPPSVLIGWIPFEAKDGLVGKASIQDIHYTEVFAHELPSRDERTMAITRFFNAAVRGEIAEEHRRPVESALVTPSHARAPDMREPPPFDEATYIENLRAVGLDIEDLKNRGLYEPQSASRGTLGNSDDMTGTVALSVFFIESDGSGTDPDLYTWTVEDMQSYLNGVAAGLAWWASQAFSHPGCSVTFLVYYYSANDPVTHQWTEPILHDTSFEFVWIPEIMSNLGYTSGGTFGRVDAFNTWQRATYQTDRAFSAFVPYNPFPAPASFSDGHTAYAYLFGPYTVLLFNISGSLTSEVFAHESGHIFGACDEYSGGCFSCGFCSHSADNGNCEVCNPDSRDCMMKTNDFALCNFTPGQIGWDDVPCTPPPPAPLPSPTVNVFYPATVLQGLSTSVTIGGSNFFAGAFVDFGPSIFVDKVTLVGGDSLKVDLTALGDAPLTFYGVTVTNRDFQSANLPNAIEVLPTTRHYFSDVGNNVYPYVTPADAATSLDDAVAASFDGDTLFVPTDTMPNFTIQIDKGVLLHGAWDNGFTTRDLQNGKTILQLAGNVSIFPGSVGAGLDGFIVENGSGSFNITPFTGYYGGGVRILSATATIANCEIRNCTASEGANLGLGGGIYAEDSTVDIRDNTIWGNTATLGGAFYLHNCSGSVDNNTIDGNAVSFASVPVAVPPEGAGIYVDGCNGLSLDGNTFANNTGSNNGGAMLVESSTGISVSGGSVAGHAVSFSGGGFQVEQSGIDVSGVGFTANSAVLGGGVATTDGSATLTECVFKLNAGAIGGGVAVSMGDVDIAHNLFIGNTGSSGGGAMSVSGVVNGEVFGNTLDRNTAGSGAGGISVTNTDIRVFNNIVANSTGDGIAVLGTPQAALSYNMVVGSSGADVSGASPGPGSGSWMPAFVDTANGDYHLGVHSGAIDAGDPAVLYNDPDGSRGDVGRYGSHGFVMAQPVAVANLSAQLQSGDVVLNWDANPEGDVAQYAVYCDSVSGFKPDGTNFVQFVTSPGTSVNLGAVADTAYYVVNAVDTSGYAGGYSGEASIGTATAVGDGPVVYENRLYQNVPNPFNPTTTIGYELSVVGEVSLVVYDAGGRLVRRLVEGTRGVGRHTAVWDGRNEGGERVSSGVYFYRLKTERFAQTKKMVLLK